MLRRAPRNNLQSHGTKKRSAERFFSYFRELVQAGFEQDAVAGELFGYFIDNKLVSIIVATTAPEEFEDVLGVPGTDWPDSKRPCMLCRLCVDVNYRRRGIGEYMMHHAEAEAKRRGADALWLLVATDNPTAFNIYKRIGYRLCGRANIYNADFYCCAKDTIS